jgi:hypothetical protein
MEIKHRNELYKLLNEEGLTRYGAEIGVLHGEYSNHLLENWKGKKLYMIDCWRFFTVEADPNNIGNKYPIEDMLVTLRTIYKHGNRAVLIRELSIEAAEMFKNEFFDFVYIDASHDEKNVWDDLNIWYPKVKKGEYLMGHDYLNGTVKMESTHISQIYGVKKAVDTFAQNYGLSVLTTKEKNFPSWYIGI